MPVNNIRQTRLRPADPGKLTGMNATDLLSVPFRAGATLRQRRFFHPVGVLALGRLERLAPPGTGLPVESGPALSRVSKGVGSPGGLPDFAGLAWRMMPSAFAATPWDVLLVSAGAAPPPLDRVALRPVSSWASAPYSSLMPLRHQGRLWWVRARVCTELGSGLSLDLVRAAVNGEGLVFDIEQACGRADFAPLARLTLSAVRSGDPAEPSFDPILHTAPDVVLWPDWLRHLREEAYRGSREGRPGGQSGGSDFGGSATSGVSPRSTSAGSGGDLVW